MGCSHTRERKNYTKMRIGRSAHTEDDGARSHAGVTVYSLWNRALCLGLVYSLQVACATLELVFLLRVRQMKAPASISLGRSTP